MNCVGFEKHHFLKCFVFLQSRYRSFPRNNTLANSLDYVQTNVSRLLPVHHHKYEYHYRIRWKMYNRCRIRPTQPVFPRRFLEAHRMEFLCLFVASIPAGSPWQHDGQLSKRHWTVFWKSDGFINLTPFPLRREKWLSLFPHHICTAGCDLLQDWKIFL